MRTQIVLFLSLAACGKVSSLVDGQPSGSNFDGNTADSATPGVDASTNVSVTVLDPTTGAPLSGVPVVFTDPTGTAVSHPSTDANGLVTQSFATGGEITAVTPTGATSYELFTVLGVKPGDAITINQPPRDQSSSTFTVTLAAYPAVGFVASYAVYGPCGSTGIAAGTNVTLNLTGYCTPKTMDIVAIAYDPNDNVLGYVEKSGVTYSSGGSVSMPSAWQTMQSSTVTVTNITSDITTVGASRFWPDTRGYGASGLNGTQNGSTWSADITGPIAMTGVSETIATNSSRARSIVRQTNAGNATSYNFDASGILPFVTSPTLDVSTGTVTIPTSGSGTAKPDLVASKVEYNHVVGNTTTTVLWVIYGPDTSNVVLPQIPTAVGNLNPAAGDTSLIIANAPAALVDYDNINGYDEARQNPTIVFNEFANDPGYAAQTAKISEPALK